MALLLFLGNSVLLPPLANAGGPRYVAGSSYFDPATKGTPVTWAQGAVHYYTDQGNLSTLLPGTAADAFVADAFGRWTGVFTAALSATRDGQLDEDVSGANVTMLADGSVNLPADILPAATAKPVAIVYDADGAVTEALYGSSSSCFTNAVFSLPPSMGTDAHFTHALIVLNGVCATTQDQLADMKYRLIREIGRVLGLDWSQVNLNPSPGSLPGFSVMHELDSFSCVPISACYGASAATLKTDDRAAISRLYPVTAANIASFPGKQLFYEFTFRVQGSVRFVGANGLPGPPMQGVNVVARWIDPVTRAVSNTFVASCVSGFKFRGNAGNPLTGFTDDSGSRFDQFGSDDPAFEGSFDLAGMEPGAGAIAAEFLLTVEPIDPFWSQYVGPYAPAQVWPSGVSPSIIVRPIRGGNLNQDILMQGSATKSSDRFGAQNAATPAALPPGGDWNSSLSSYGAADYFRLSGQANRTLSVEVTALNEAGVATQSKALPAIGIWTVPNDASPAEAFTLIPFNTGTFGLTRLDHVSLLRATDFRLGIADYRGDGRPDFQYHARVFYGDRVIPARASVGGGSVLSIQGLGFRSNTTIMIGAASAPLLGISVGQLQTLAPALPDGVQDVLLFDPATGASAAMTAAVTYGAGPNDTIKLLSGTNPPTPVGAAAPNPFCVRVAGPDGATPVAGASVVFQSAPAASLSACGGAASCTVLTDQSGQASTAASLRTHAPSTITAQLAPASYSPAKQVVTTLVPAAASALDIAMASENIWVAEGATFDLPVSARVIASGVPQSARSVNFQIVQGNGSLSSANATTDAGGNAVTTVHLAAIAREVQILACVAPANLPCTRLLTVFPVAPSRLRLQPVSGNLQVLSVGQPFQPLRVRISDSDDPSKAHPVAGASVLFQATITRPQNDGPTVMIGDTNIHRNPPPVILGSYQLTAISGADGLAAIFPPTSEVPAVEIQGMAYTGLASLALDLRVLAPLPTPVIPARTLAVKVKTVLMRSGILRTPTLPSRPRERSATSLR